ncbi:MAG: SurA N-terminal domain-containing protein, partial [Lysobacteraceae bacterium]
MLQQIRKATSGWIAGVILGLIIITFALWGINGYFQGQVDTWLARTTIKPGWFGTSISAKTRDISADDFRTAFENYRQQQRNQQGEKFDAANFDTPARRLELLDQMVERDLMVTAAEADGIQVGAAQLQAAIAAIPAFQALGKFDPIQYRQALYSLNKSPREFEDGIRRDMLADALPNAIFDSGFATDVDLDTFLRLSMQTRDLRYFEIGAPANATSTPDAAAIAAWYKAHPAMYRSPEQIALEYIELDASTLQGPTTVDEATLQASYNDQKSRFIEPEQRLASHILIKVPENAPAAVEKAAQAKAAALATQARTPGTDFADLAKDSSEDIGSKGVGGDLGWLSPGVTLKPFETALYAMQPGQISDPVRTTEGWHVIQMRDLRPGRQVPFEQVRAQLEREAADAGRERIFSDRSGKLVDSTLKDPTTLAPAARELGLTVQKTALFARGGGVGIAADPKIQRKAFLPETMQSGDNSDPVEISPNHVVVFRVAQHQQASTLPLASVTDRVIADIQTDQRAKAAKLAAEAMLARAKKGEGIEALASAN